MQPGLHRRDVACGAVWFARAATRVRTAIPTFMIEIDPTARIGAYEYVGLEDYIASLFDGPVDIVNREALKPFVKPTATADAIYAF